MTDTTDRSDHRELAEISASYAELVGQMRATFDTGRTRSIKWRHDQLDGLLAMIADHTADFVRAIQDDLGRHSLEAFAADIGHAKEEIRYLRKNCAKWAKPRKVRLPITAMPGKGRVVPEPLGVALVIAPWNYPIQLLIEPLAAAISAGNCVVCKPSELAPASSAVLAQYLPKYLDNDAITVVEGAVDETTALLEQRFDHIFFTGSTAVGKVVMAAAAKHLTPVTLELGGKSPVIVSADANLSVAAKRIVWGKHLNAGQTCIAPDYVLAEASIRDELVEHMVAAIEEFVGTDPKASKDFARIINQRHHGRITSLLDDHGGTVRVGGQSDVDDKFVAPTIIVDPDLESRIMQEEIFGPLLPVLAVESIDAAIDFVVARDKPLALYVFASESTAEEVLGRTSSGGACINHTLMHIMPATLPFGGVGASGMGSYHGRAGFDVFSHHKSILSKPTFPDPPILYPPYDSWKEKLIRKVMG